MARRKGAAGTGTIRRRPDGRWEARLTIGYNPETGKQTQRSIYGKTQKEVRQKLQKLAVEVNMGRFVEPSRITVEEWLREWLLLYKPNIRESTRKNYEGIIKKHILPCLGTVKLQELTSRHLQSLSVQLSKNLKSGSARNVMAVIADALGAAKKAHLISENPASDVVLPRMSEPEIKPLSHDEIIQLLNAAGDDMRPLITVAIFTGLRIGELIGLCWDNVDNAHNLISVDHQLIYTSDGEAVFAPTKNGKRRSVPMAKIVRQALEKQRQWQKVCARVYRWQQPPSGLVFTHKDGRPLNSATVFRRLRTLGKQIGRPDLSAHKLRHTYVTNSIAAGDNPRSVQAHVGHSSSPFMLRVYAHVMPDMECSSAAKMDAFVDQLHLLQ